MNNSSGGSHSITANGGGKRTPSAMSQQACPSCGAQQQAGLFGLQHASQAAVVEPANRATHFNISSLSGFTGASGSSCILMSNGTRHVAALASVNRNDSNDDRDTPANKRTRGQQIEDSSKDLCDKHQRQPSARILHHARPHQVSRCMSSDLQDSQFRSSAGKPGTNQVQTRTRLAKSMGRVNEANEMEKRKQEIGSLTRLNASSSNNINESISSFGVNDSCLNTSQENTPCSGAGGANSRRHRISSQHDFECSFNAADRGSDSALWNQSVYSLVDYCSDCCPSYCGYCSCYSNGADEFSNLENDAEPGQCSALHHVNDMDLTHNQSDRACEHSDMEPKQLLPAYRAHNRNSMHQTTSSSLDLTTGDSASMPAQLCCPNANWRRKSDQQWAMGCGLRNLQASFPRPIVDDLQPNTATKNARHSQTMEMKTIGIFTAVQPTNATNPNGRLKNTKKSRSEEDPSPIAFALQAAANSALGACTIESRVAASGDQRLKMTRTTATNDKKPSRNTELPYADDMSDDNDNNDDELGQLNQRRVKRTKASSRQASSTQTKSELEKTSRHPASGRPSTKKQQSSREQTSSRDPEINQLDHAAHESILCGELDGDDADVESCQQVGFSNRQACQQRSSLEDSNRIDTASELSGQIDELGVNQVALVALALGANLKPTSKTPTSMAADQLD